MFAKIVHWNKDRGFGFGVELADGIEIEGSRVFIHYKSITFGTPGQRNLTRGSIVEYELATDTLGRTCAGNVQLVSAPELEVRGDKN